MAVNSSQWSSFCTFTLLVTVVSPMGAESTKSAANNEVKRLLVQYENSQAEMTKSFRRILEIILSKRVQGETLRVQGKDFENDHEESHETDEHKELQKDNHDFFDGISAENFISTEGSHSQPKEPQSESKTSDLSPHLIYMTTWDKGVLAYSLHTGEVEAFAYTWPGDHLRGVAYDSAQNQVYWSSQDIVYRDSVDGTAREEVLSLYENTSYTMMTGLAFDWVTGNVYGVTQSGHTFVCNSKTSAVLQCVTLVTEAESPIWGIALNPVEGTMYWTFWNGIKRASMDGSDTTEIVSNLRNLRGISFDFAASRIYWIDYGNDVIQSSDPNGADPVTVVRLTAGTVPIGIIILEDRIYWGNAGGGGSLQTSTKAGHDVRTLVNGTSAVWQLATSAPEFGYSYRKNDCEGKTCDKMCVLKSNSYRCVS